MEHAETLSSDRFRYHGGATIIWRLPKSIFVRHQYIELLKLVQEWSEQVLDRCWIQHQMRAPKKIPDVEGFLKAAEEGLDQRTVGVGNKQSTSGSAGAVLLSYAGSMPNSGTGSYISLHLDNQFADRDFLSVFLSGASLLEALWGRVLVAHPAVYDIRLCISDSSEQTRKDLPDWIAWHNYWSAQVLEEIARQLHLPDGSRFSDAWPGVVNRSADGWFVAIGEGDPTRAGTGYCAAAVEKALKVFPRLRHCTI